ncbi:MAG TPA: hypothetical protein VIU62_12025 [Chloroflexota bacterium]|jgi:hypothetical protein
MARLQFDGDSGCYVGTRLVIAGSAVSRRIRLLTEAHLQQGVDPVDAAEAAWNTALEEASWDTGEEGVTSRPPEQDISTGPR